MAFFGDVGPVRENEYRTFISGATRIFMQIELIYLTLLQLKMPLKWNGGFRPY